MTNSATPDDARDAPAPTCIGLFDSGVGGLSVLQAIRQRLPGARMIYVGDVAHAPYGEREAADVIERSLRIVEWLVERGATLVVVACNTATALAVEELRQRWPALPLIGVEPGVKPAVALSRTRRIAVMATPATAGSARLQGLIDRFAEGAHVHVQPCAGLAGAIERGLIHGPLLIDLLRPLCGQVRAANVDTVVLGCTHYGFVAASIQGLLGSGMTLVDTAPSIAEQAARLCGPTSHVTHSGDVRVFSTGETTVMLSLLRAGVNIGSEIAERIDL